MLDQSSSRLKLIHITTVPQALSFFHGQVGFMQERGLDVHAISSLDERLSEFGQQEGVRTHAVAMSRRITPIQDLQALVRLTIVIRRLRPAIVHAHTPKGGFLGMISAWLNRVPVRIYSLHGLRYMTTRGKKRIILRWTDKIACRLSHEVICVSHSLRKVVIEDGICDPGKVRVLLRGSVNGVDAAERYNPARFSGDDRIALRAELGLSPGQHVIGFLGRIVPDKGIQELFDAWKEIRGTWPNVILLLVGPVETQDPIDPEVLQALQADPRVIFTGSVADTSEKYALLDTVVLPTHREGFGIVLLEAAAMELPVVATEIPGCVDAVVNGITGTLVPPQDVGALQAAIERYLDDPELRRRHGTAGRERVLRDFRREDIWEAVYQEYVRLLEEKDVAMASPEGMSHVQ